MGMTRTIPKVSAEAYVMNEEVLAQAVEILSKEHLENVAMDSTIFRNLSLKEAADDLSVPYEEGGRCRSTEKMQRLSSLAMRSWHLIWKRENIRYRCTMYGRTEYRYFSECGKCMICWDACCVRGVTGKGKTVRRMSFAKGSRRNDGRRECGKNAHRGRFCEGRGRKDVRRSEL